MSVSVRYDEGNGIYELGGEIEGVFVAFAQLDAGDVGARVANGKQAQADAQATSGAGQAETQTGDTTSQGGSDGGQQGS